MLVASCLVVGSTTVEAADFNLSDYPYKYYCSFSSQYPNYQYIVAVSNKQLLKVSHSGSYSYSATDLNTRLTYSISKSSSHYYWGVSSMYFPVEMYILTYDSVNSWQVHLPWLMTGNGSNVIAWDLSSTDYSTTVPSGMPEIVIEDIDSAIRGVLNDTTQTTTQAQQIQVNISNIYTSYQNGGITSSEMQQAIDSAISQLNTFNENSGNTLADLIAIQNALTHAQTVQDELLNRPSTTVITNVQNVLQGATTLLQQYQSGSVPQGQAMQQLRAYAYQLSQLMNGNPSISDVEAINTGVNTINNFIDILSNSTELDKTVSDKAQQSDSEELEYLQSLETTSTISDLSPSQQMQSQASGVQPLLSVVWDNELIKIVLPLTAGFLVVSVALGRKFKL
nr:unnamed protein product [uncultured bacterium]